jgi:MFS family permease
MFLFSLRFSGSFWVVFLRSRGLSFAWVGLLETIFHIASLCGEIPTGWIADRFGRKTSLIVGRVLALVSAAITLLARSPAALALAFIVSALSYTCHSGAYEALVFDELRTDGRDGEFTKVMGSLNAVYLAGSSLAAICGGLIARRALTLLYVFSIGVDALAILLLLPLRERPLPGAAAGKSRLSPLNDLRELINALRDRRLATLMLLFACVSALETSFIFYGQAYMRELGVPVAMLGLVGMAGQLLAILPTQQSHRLERKLGLNRALSVCTLLCVAVITATGLCGPTARWPFVIATILCHIVYETLYPLFSSALNALAPSERRATVLSTAGMFFSIVMMLVFPAVGVLGDRVGLGRGILLSGCAVLGASIVLIRRIRTLHSPISS